MEFGSRGLRVLEYWSIGVMHLRLSTPGAIQTVGQRSLLPLFPKGGEGWGAEVRPISVFQETPLSSFLPTRSSRGERGANRIATARRF